MSSAWETNWKSAKVKVTDKQTTGPEEKSGELDSIMVQLEIEVKKLEIYFQCGNYV